MPYEWLIGLRYLTSTRSRSAPSIITVFAVLGEAIGVAALILVLSIMGGFEGDLRTKILGSKSHILVTGPSHAELENPSEVLEIIDEMPQVTGASPFIESELMISSPANYAGIVMRGINIERLIQSTDIETTMVEGEFENLLDPDSMRRGSTLPSRNLPAEIERLEQELSETEQMLERIEQINEPISDPPSASEQAIMPALPAPNAQAIMPTFPAPETSENTTRNFRVIPGVIIGGELQETLLVRVGDTVDIISPDGELGPTGPIPRARRFRIVGVFHTGLFEYDSKMIYVTLDAARNFLDYEEEIVTGIEVKIEEMDHSELVAENLATQLQQANLSAKVSDWKELNKSLFSALLLEKKVMFVLLLIIVFVASFAIVCVLIMVVIEKGREIGILRSMGASRRSISMIFMLDGALIGVFGTLLGVFVGLGLTTYLQIVGWPLDPEVYYIDRLPVEVNHLEVLLIAATAIIISLLATIYPSVQAARLDPVTALRYD